MIVVDASVAVKWLWDEPGSDEAAQLLSGPRKVIAPDLLHIEVAAAVTRRFRLGDLSEDEARRVCGDWMQALDNGAVLLLPSADHMERAVDLAVQTRHPLQDCLYLAVARALDAPLATSNPKFRDRAEKIYSAIEFIGPSKGKH